VHQHGDAAAVAEGLHVGLDEVRGHARLQANWQQ
jgi:hypothetical protein